MTARMPALSRADRVEVQSYDHRFQQRPRGAITSAEIAAFAALTPAQLDLLLTVPRSSPSEGRPEAGSFLVRHLGYTGGVIERDFGTTPSNSDRRTTDEASDA